MARVAGEAEAALQGARTAALRAQREVQGAMAKVGSARTLLAQTNQELLGSASQGAQGQVQGTQAQEIPEWLQLETLLSMREEGICWQEVLRRLGMGPGLQIGEAPVMLGQQIPRHLMMRLDIAYALQQGVPIHLSIPRVPQSQSTGSQMVEDAPQESVQGSVPVASQEQLEPGSASTQEHFSM